MSSRRKATRDESRRAGRAAARAAKPSGAASRERDRAAVAKASRPAYRPKVVAPSGGRRQDSGGSSLSGLARAAGGGGKAGPGSRGGSGGGSKAAAGSGARGAAGLKARKAAQAAQQAQAKLSEETGVDTASVPTMASPAASADAMAQSEAEAEAAARLAVSRGMQLRTWMLDSCLAELRPRGAYDRVLPALETIILMMQTWPLGKSTGAHGDADAQVACSERQSRSDRLYEDVRRDSVPMPPALALRVGNHPMPQLKRAGEHRVERRVGLGAPVEAMELDERRAGAAPDHIREGGSMRPRDQLGLIK